MKITAIMGSPAKNGNTCTLAREVLRGAGDSGCDTEEIFLMDHHIEYCKGCIGRTSKHCMSTGICNIHDDTAVLKSKLYESDGIVLASPSYGIKPTAVMKNFLTDRIGMFTTYTSGFGGKYIVAVSSCGGIGAKKVARDIAKDCATGFHRWGNITGCIGVSLGYDRIESKPEVMAQAYRLGVKLASDITKKRKYPLQNIKDKILIAVFARRIIQKNIYANKDGAMNAVYRSLAERGLLS